jgi:hypothetical protein
MINSIPFLLKTILTLVKLIPPFYTKREGKDILNVQIYVYVLIFGAIDECLCKDFTNCIQEEFEMSMMGKLNFFIRLQIKQKG